ARGHRRSVPRLRLGEPRGPPPGRPAHRAPRPRLGPRHAPGPARAPRRAAGAHAAARARTRPGTRRLLPTRHRHRPDRPRRLRHPGPASSDPEGAPGRADSGSHADVEAVAQTTRYTSYTVFRRLSGLTEDGEVTTEQIEQSLTDTVRLMESASESGVEVLGFYDVSGFRAEDDLMVWMAAEDPAGL